MAFTSAANFANAVWQMSVWSPLLKTLFHTNIDIGYIAAASGVGQLVASIGSGWGADKLGKERVVRAAAVMGILSSVAVAVGVYYEHFITLLVANFASGWAYGSFFPAVEGIFADSVPDGQRTFLYNVKYGFERLSCMSGFIVALVMFGIRGDDWDVHTMKLVVYAGLAISFLSSFLLFFIREKYTVQARALLDDVVVDADGEERGGASSNDQVGNDADEEELWELVDRHAPGFLPQRLVPFAVAIKDVIVSLGSGMTVMFVALFLIDDYSISPMRLQAILLSGTLLSALLSQGIGAAVGDSGKCATADGKPRFNRIGLMMVPLGWAVIGIWYLALAKTGALSALGPTLFIYISRYGAMNSFAGLSRAVLMDTVRRQHRAKWNIFESIANASWAGSAMIGGAIADKWDYRATFLITAVCHTVAFLILSTAARNPDRPPAEMLANLGISRSSNRSLLGSAREPLLVNRADEHGEEEEGISNVRAAGDTP